MNRFSLTTRRIVLVVVCIPLMLSLIGEDFVPRIFGRYSQLALGVCMLIAVFSIFGLGPGVLRDMMALKEQRRQQDHIAEEVVAEGITISRESNVFYKWWLPFLIYVGIATAWVYFERDFSVFGIVSTVVILLFIGCTYYFFLKRSIWSTADEVVDCGEELLIRFGRKSEHIPLKNIEKIEIFDEYGGDTVVLQLVIQCLFGKRIRFFATPSLRSSKTKFGIMINLSDGQKMEG